MSTSTVAPEIAAFASAVRAALADLPAEEVDDLTEGLEADLAESMAEDLRRTLPDPVAYAVELRLAAGLPRRTEQPPRGAFSRLAAVWQSARVEIAEALDRNPSLGEFASFAGALRPAWWVLRALIAAWLLAMFFGSESVAVVASMLFVPISVQWGRGRWSFPGVKGLVVAGNVLAVLAVPAMASAGWWGSHDTSYSYSPDVPSQSGLSMDGRPLDNVYAYDAAGNKLTGVQLFDVDGTPLTVGSHVDETQALPSPATLETGAKVYNVYPLAITRMTYDDLGDLVPDPSPDPDKAAAYANGPFLKVPAVQIPAAPAPQQPVAQPNE